MSKKVIKPVIIEQKKHHQIRVVYHPSENRIVLSQEKSGLPKAYLGIEEASRTTVAKAICPEYQKVIDHNKFLEVENSRLTKVYQKSVNKTHELNDQNAKLVEAFRKQIEIAYRCGESGKTYFFEDTTCILPRNYEGIDG